MTAVRSRAGARMPQGLLDRIRVLFCLFAILNLGLLLPAILVGDDRVAVVIGLAGAVALAWVWTRAVRRGHLTVPVRVAEPALVLAVAWGAVQIDSVLGVYYVGLYYGALYGSRTATIVRGAAYWGVFASASVLDAGAAAFASPTLWAHAWGALLSSLVLSMLADAVRAQEASERAKDEFLSVVSHELRTPLTSLLGLLETLETHDARLTPERRAHLITRARVNADRQRQLIEDLLDVSRATRGTLQPDATDVVVAPLVIEVMESMDIGGTVEVDVARGHVAWVDRGHLHQMLSNLLSNAAKYGAPPIEVTTSLDAEAGTLALHVQDRGPGVSPTFVPSLFERFTQESTGNRRTASGVGLGLWITRELAHANNGTLEHGDVAPGARFTLTLPVGDRPATPPREDPEAVAPPAVSTAGRVPRVLLRQ